MSGQRISFLATRQRGSLGELQSPGTGPFFGQKKHLSEKGSAENMDLSPLLGTLQFSWVVVEKWLLRNFFVL